MMKYLRVTGVLALAVGLTACSSMVNDKNYAKHAATVPPIVVPKGAKAPKLQPYYKVPAVARTADSMPPSSLVPPGSKILQYRAKAKPGHHAGATLSKAKNGAPALALAESNNQAWAKVGRALRQTHYQVLDQDSGLGAYYVLDTAATNNAITTKTPIYRVSVQKMGKDSQVTVLNQYNRPANTQIAKRILTAVQKHLG